MNRRLAGLLSDRFVASDPERARLRGAVRAWLTAAIGAAILLGIAHLLQQPAKLALIGVVVPLMSAVAVQDPTPAQQRITMLLLPLVAAPAAWLGAWLHDAPLAAGVVFLIVIVAGFEGRRFGPRGVALGTIAYLAYFYALLLKPDPGSGFVVAGFLVVGTTIAYGVRLLTPDRRDRVLRQQLRALRARMALLLRALLRSLDASDHQRAAARVQRQVEALNAQSLALDARLAQLAGHDDAGDAVAVLRDRLLHDELAAESLASAVAALLRRSGEQQALRAALCGLLQSVRGGTRFDADTFQAQHAHREDADLHWRLRHALHVIADEPAWALPLPSLQPARTPSATDGRAATAQRRRWFALDEPTRQAIQGAVAAAGAGIAGHFISPDHWFWAVFASFVVFTRASNVAQTLSQTWKGVLATVAGVALGLAVADAVGGHTALQLVLLYVFIAVGFYAYRGLQSLYSAMLTSMLAMLYGLLGMDASGLLVIRLQETLAGAAIALASGLVVFPVRTQDHADRESAALLRKAAQVLREAFDAAQPPPARDAVRALDRELQSLRSALGPVTETSYPAHKQKHRQRLHQLTRLAYCLRHLYRVVDEHPAELRGDAALADCARHVSDRLCEVAARLEGHEAASSPHGKPLPSQPADDDRLRLARHWLRHAGAIADAMAAEVA
ncbi:FUSC family protein [Ramlibacter sp.]|uniref:FUSC family protein n=1 Tax=Ramlibacter sp. TaxID=1917967 RepID=UPI002637C221|nr:FUSC family protein [Ramlibacter sp.]MDB5956835.1 hypothetical protein [Ramlibacter sp.]